MPSRIPRTLHYCWFGREPEPAYVAESVESWRAAMPDFEVRRWDEDDWDPQAFEFSAAAYAAEQWAFVSDMFRFDVLSRHGGIYLDTDVRAIRSLTPFLGSHAFLGMMVSDSIGTAVIGSEPGGELVSALRERWAGAPHDFGTPSNDHVTGHLLSRYPEFVLANVDQQLSDGTVVLRKEYFERHTHDPRMGFTVHFGAGSWRGADPEAVTHPRLRRILGPVNTARLSNLLTIPRAAHVRSFVRHKVTRKRPRAVDLLELGAARTSESISGP